MNLIEIKHLLDEKSEFYEQTDFIKTDPISIPHQFIQKPDIEIAALFAATLSWGSRSAIINSCNRLLNMMDNAPHEFILNHQKADLEKIQSFVHRTFQPLDLLYFIEWLHDFYLKNDSLETAFFGADCSDVKTALINYHNNFKKLPQCPQRTLKHVSTPDKGSACKRLNMFLRWMIRKNSPVDFGIWHTVSPKQLMLPLDIHTGRVARYLGIISRKQNDWKAVEELTQAMRRFDPDDPAKYDFALFALGVNEKYK